MTETIQIDSIVIRDNHRTPDAQKVEQIAQSIKLVGLINPITVNQDNVLCAGRHRLEAYKQLGYDAIPYHRDNITSDNTVDYAHLEHSEAYDLLLQLVEIDENLARNEGTQLWQSEELARRKRIYELLYPETKHGKTSGNQYTGQKRENDKLSFSQNTSQATGTSERSIERKVRRAEKLPQDVKDMLHDTPVANSGVELDTLVKVAEKDEEQARAIARQVKNKEVDSVRDAVSMHDKLADAPQEYIDFCTRMQFREAWRVEWFRSWYDNNHSEHSKFGHVEYTGILHFDAEDDVNIRTATQAELRAAEKRWAKVRKSMEIDASKREKEMRIQALKDSAPTLDIPDGVDIVHDDCLNYLPTLPSESIDLIIVDPPYYGVVADAWDNQWHTLDDYLSWCKKWMIESLRVLKPTGSFYIWGGVGENASNIIHQKLLLDSVGFHFKEWITWQKRRGMGHRRGWLHAREELLWYVKDNDSFIWNESAQYSEEPNQFTHGFGGHAVKSEYKRIPNVWTDIPEVLGNKGTLHYTPKPVSALERIIKVHTSKSDTVLDFFAGTGTTGKASIIHSRKAILVEADDTSIAEMTNLLGGTQ